jgi:hypothetical protein
MARRRIQRPAWRGKVGHHAQLGGIETAVLDNGPGRGVRVAWVNTGTPLRYRVVLDRAMDVAEAFYGPHSLAWISHGGVTAPKPDAGREQEWLYAFGGGLLTTCGLGHTGAAESDGSVRHGLHGRISQLPAQIEAVVQPDLASAQPQMRITGVMRESRVFGPSLELRRTIGGRLGEAAIVINDRVTNAGNRPAPLMLLYHFNFGWPLVDRGAELVWEGRWQSRGTPADNRVFREGRDFKVCPGVLASHAGNGEACAFIRPRADRRGLCTAGIRNRRLGLGAAIRFRRPQLPWLTNWQHWGENEFVTGLEPGTNPPVGQRAAREAGQLTYLEPGESRSFDIELRAAAGEREVKALFA